MYNFKIKTVSLVILLVFAGSVFARQQAFLTAQEILAAWEKNYGSLSSFEVECEERVLSAVPGTDPNSDIATKVIKYIGVHRIEQGDKFCCSVTALRTPEELVTYELSFDGIEQREYIAKEKSGMIFPNVQRQDSARDNLIDRYLLRRKERSRLEALNNLSQFKKPFELARLYPTLRTVRIRPFLEEINGQMCHVVELFLEDDNMLHRIIWVAHEKNMLPMKYQRFERETEDTEYAHTDIEVLEIAFAKTDNGGLWYPKKARRIDCFPRHYTISYEIVVSEFVPNVTCDPNIFKIAFPNGTRVMDTRINESYVVGVEQ